jgi:ABC-type antimicrobial peptide transport system permease subunit
MSPMWFVLAAVVGATVALATVALQSYRAASADPVEALRQS